MKVVLASKNKHKLLELQSFLSQHDIQVVLQSELGIDIEVEETGSTFEENSMLKAQAVMQAAGLPAIADDSGLEVEALNGAPGIYSARYGGAQNHSDADRVQYLLEKLKDVPAGARAARFVSVVTLVYPDGRSIVARGTCDGEIADEPRGTGGFGYDPVFYMPAEGCTFAQLTQQRKDEISHRANALNSFVQKLTGQMSGGKEQAGAAGCAGRRKKC